MTDNSTEDCTLKLLSVLTWEKNGDHFIICVERRPRLYLEALKNNLDKATQDSLDFHLISGGEKIRMRLSVAQYVFKLAGLNLNIIEPKKGLVR